LAIGIGLSAYLSNAIIIENTHRITVTGVKIRSSKLLFENKFPMVLKKNKTLIAQSKPEITVVGIVVLT